jgi:hypothetical protein
MISPISMMKTTGWPHLSTTHLLHHSLGCYRGLPVWTIETLITQLKGIAGME